MCEKRLPEIKPPARLLLCENQTPLSRHLGFPSNQPLTSITHIPCRNDSLLRGGRRPVSDHLCSQRITTVFMLTQDPCKLELGGCWVTMTTFSGIAGELFLTMQWWAGLKLPQTQAIRKAWRTAAWSQRQSLEPRGCLEFSGDSGSDLVPHFDLLPPFTRVVCARTLFVTGSCYVALTALELAM